MLVSGPMHQQLDRKKSASLYVRLEHSTPLSKNTVVVNWCVGNTCNYKCSYCPDSLHRGDLKWVDLETAKKFSEKVFDHFRGQKLYFEFTGGEVSLWSGLLDLSGFLRAQGASVGFISNGSRHLDWWEKAVRDTDQVCLSFHLEKSDPDHFLKVLELVSRQIRTHVNVMMKPEEFDTCLKWAERFHKIPDITLALQPLIVDFTDQLFKYTPKQLKILKKETDRLEADIRLTKPLRLFRGKMEQVFPDGRRVLRVSHDLIAAKENNWFGWDCHIGLEQIVVNFNGDVFSGWCGEGGRLGHISDQDIRLPGKPTRCGRTMCHCNLDVMVTKVNPEFSKK